jgi:maltooligosyltrehalose trehalohydrolase
MVVDPAAFSWSDHDWRGLDPAGQVVYELHVGTFTPEGTFAAAAAQFGTLRKLGVTCVELMPVNEFSGRWGWGYDGVDLFAPFHHYGTPDSLRALVDSAHQVGLGVILDVVYNHVGADGNYLPVFSENYFTAERATDWGKTFDYAIEPVRRFAIDNAVSWIREYHMDGLRLDATQSIHDPEHPALLAAISRETRAAAHPRSIVLAGEDYLQRADLLLSVESGGAGLDHLWNDDFHHASRVALTGNRGGYFKHYRGSAQELLSTLKHGFLFQGQYDEWQGRSRGSAALSQSKTAFVAFMQNHDQVANTLYGRRIGTLTSPARARAMTTMLLLGPQTPLLFMGQEFDSSSLFAYFADYDGRTAAALWASRKREIEVFEQYASVTAQAAILNPCDPETFLRSKLNFTERELHVTTYRLYEDLLALRRDDEVLSRRPQAEVDGAVLDEHAFVVRWFDPGGADRLLLVNLGGESQRRTIAEPLLAPPAHRNWRSKWSSEEIRYGGMGSAEPVNGQGWHLQAETASFLVAEADSTRTSNVA